MELTNPLPKTQPEYIAQLIAFYGFVVPWEERLATALPATDLLRQGRGKTGWLDADLDFFGYAAAAREKLPRLTELPSTPSRIEMLGVSYVLEGSTLGGRIIAQHLQKELHLTGPEGCRFFLSYGDHVGTQWQAFRAELQRVSGPASDPVIIQAARDTFHLLDRWFGQAKAWQ